MQILIVLGMLLCMAATALMYLLCAFSGHTDQEKPEVTTGKSRVIFDNKQNNDGRNRRSHSTFHSGHCGDPPC